ncbi:MAG: cell division protein FtsQ/DivIB [Faecousia sp.]
MDSKQKDRQDTGKSARARKPAPQGTERKASPAAGKKASQQKSAPAKRTQPAAGGNRDRRRNPQTTDTAPKRQAAPKAAAAKKRQPRQTTKTPAASAAAKKQERSQYAADIVYLPPKPFSRNRLLLRLATVAAVVVALLVGISIFFKVDKVVVSGTDKYTAWEVSQAADIMGENLLTFSRAKAYGKIQVALPYVQKVRFGIKMPDTVNIYIEEIEVTYAIADQSGSWWLISSGGKVLEKAAVGSEEGYTKLLGVQLSNPVVGQQAVALEPEPQEVGEKGETVPVTITQAHRLQTVLDLVDYLEQYGILGKAFSVDVTNMGDIQLWYEHRFQVKLGDESQLGYKIKMLKSYIDSSGKYDGGILDISFSQQENKIVYSPFD